MPTEVVTRHLALASYLTTVTDVWDLTTAAEPFAMCVFGQPTALEPYGYLMVASRAISLLGACESINQWLHSAAPDTGGWRGPISTGFALMWARAAKLDLVTWQGGHSCSGQVIRSGHPEVADGIHLANGSRIPPLFAKRTVAAYLLAVLGDTEQGARS